MWFARTLIAIFAVSTAPISTNTGVPTVVSREIKIDLVSPNQKADNPPDQEDTGESTPVIPIDTGESTPVIDGSSFLNQEADNSPDQSSEVQEVVSPIFATTEESNQKAKKFGMSEVPPDQWPLTPTEESNQKTEQSEESDFSSEHKATHLPRQVVEPQKEAPISTNTEEPTPEIEEDDFVDVLKEFGHLNEADKILADTENSDQVSGDDDWVHLSPNSDSDSDDQNLGLHEKVSRAFPTTKESNQKAEQFDMVELPPYQEPLTTGFKYPEPRITINPELEGDGLLQTAMFEVIYNHEFTPQDQNHSPGVTIPAVLPLDTEESNEVAGKIRESDFSIKHKATDLPRKVNGRQKKAPKAEILAETKESNQVAGDDEWVHLSLKSISDSEDQNLGLHEKVSRAFPTTKESTPVSREMEMVEFSPGTTKPPSKPSDYVLPDVNLYSSSHDDEDLLLSYENLDELILVEQELSESQKSSELSPSYVSEDSPLDGDATDSENMQPFVDVVKTVAATVLSSILP